MSTQRPPVRVAVVDDHVALRRGLELLLGRCGFRMVKGAESAAEAMETLLGDRPDVAVVDMRLGDDSGIALSRRLRERAPGLRVLLYTGIVDPALLQMGLEAGASGLVLKSGRPERLVAAIEIVAAGGRYVDPAIKEMLPADPRAGVLSPRERDVLRLLARGHTGVQAAGALTLSPETVRTHVRNAQRKLGAHTRTHAIVAALQSKEIEL